MERKGVISSNISSIGYDPQSMTLEVQFYDQKIYQYTPVTQEAYNNLMAAESVGSYFAKNIRNNKDIKTSFVK
jgi:hypothetical protein